MSLGGSEGTEKITRGLKQDKESTGTVCECRESVAGTQALEAPPPRGPEEWTQGS